MTKLSRSLPLLASIALAITIDTSARTAPPVASATTIPEWLEESELPKLDAEPLPADESSQPKPDEWKTAPRVRLTHTTDAERDCRAYRVREWLKIHCDRSFAGMRLLAGSPEGVLMWVPSPKKGDVWIGIHGGEVIFPVRRGDRRVFELFDLVPGDYEGFFPQSGMMVEELWPEGDASPSVALVRVR